MSNKRHRQRNRGTGPGRRRVGGEPVDALIDDLVSIEFEPEEDGMVHLHGDGLSPSFMRAFMRIEAELLLADADALATEGYEHRTPEQRAADALVEMAKRVGNAVRSAA